MEDSGWICGSCTYQNDGSQLVCAMCNTDRSAPRHHHFPFFHTHRTTITARTLRSLGAGDGSLPFSLSICSVPRILAGALSGALTGMFAVVGAFTGAVTGALAGRATDSGLLRGAGLGAVAGAVLSVEVLEASRAYWHSERPGSHQSSSVSEFIEDLLNGRFVQDQVAPAMLTANRWQVNIAEMSYEDLYEMFGPGEGAMKGASEACLEKLPRHTVTKGNKLDSSGDSISCTICLQDDKAKRDDAVNAQLFCSTRTCFFCLERLGVSTWTCISAFLPAQIDLSRGLSGELWIKQSSPPMCQESTTN